MSDITPDSLRSSRDPCPEKIGRSSQYMEVPMVHLQKNVINPNTMQLAVVNNSSVLTFL